LLSFKAEDNIELKTCEIFLVGTSTRSGVIFYANYKRHIFIHACDSDGIMYHDYSLVGFDTVKFCSWIPAFRIKFLPPSYSALKGESKLLSKSLMLL
jgi:hypothetical protein